MSSVALKLIPSVNAEYTPTLNQAGISDCNYIRFKGGLPQKLGGWQKYYPFSVSGVPRDLHAWEDLNAQSYLAVGATSSLSIINNDSLSTITPQQLVSDFAPDFSTTSSQNTVTVVDPNIANVTTSDAIFFNTPISVGGIILTGAYQIAVIGGTTSYDINATMTAASTVANGGSVPAFTTTSSSTVVQVAFAGHGLSAGDYFTFPIPTTGGGVTINGTYQVLSVIDVDNFTIATSVSASSSTTFSMNGGDAQIVYYISLGPQPGGVGYGVGAYGAGGYGSGIVPSSQTGTPIMTTGWTLDNWGQVLLACPKNGGIYQWAPNSGFLNAGLVATAPAFNTGIFVAMPQQILVAYGSTAAAPGSLPGGATSEQQDPLMVRWSDVLNFYDFVPDSGNQAGGQRLSRGSRIVGGLQGPQYAVLWTDIGVWAMTYVSGSFVFRFNEIGSGCGLIGQHAAAVLNNVVYWMGTNNFFRLSPGGAVESIPCSVWDTVFQDIDASHQDKCVAAANSSFDEIWFFYPSDSGGTGEIDKYAKFNVSDNAWDYGSLSRTAWIDQSVLGQPIGASPSGIIFQHETTMDADGQPMSWYFETGYFVLAEGTNIPFIDWFFPDMKWGFYGGAQNASVQITITAVDYPNGAPRVYGPFTMTDAKEYINCRLRGRQIKLRFSGNDLGTFARLGNMRFRVAPMGRR